VSATYSLPEGYSVQFSMEAGSTWKNQTSVFFTKSYFKALEETHLNGFSYIYGELYKGTELAALLYFQLIDLSHIKIGSVIQTEPYGKFMKLVSEKITSSLLGTKRSKVHYMLVHGNMCVSGNYGTFLLPEHKRSFPSIYKKLYESAWSYAEESGVVSVSIIKDFPFEDDSLSQELQSMGFIRFVMDPVMRMNISSDWKSFEDYLQTLSSKYRLRAVNVIEKLHDFRLEELQESDINKYKDELNVLYQSVISKSPVRIAQTDMDYIIQLKKHVPGFTVKAWFQEERPVAFFTAFKTSEVTEAHHIGIDYHLNRTHALYQNILYGLIDIAIKNGSAVLDYGRTAMEMKSTVGATPYNFAAYIKMSNRVMNHLVKPFMPSEPPKNWVQRDPFRKN